MNTGEWSGPERPKRELTLTPEELEKRIKILTTPAKYRCEGERCTCVPNIINTLDLRQRREIVSAYESQKRLPIQKGIETSPVPRYFLHNIRDLVTPANREEGWFRPLMKIMQEGQKLPENTLVKAIVDTLIN